jgi:DNA-binding winged helix-turn-helix (wHTH) protein/cytochrome c-type biogenesis protein CcmH/NrfG
MVNTIGHEVYEFGEFVLDVSERRFCKGEQAMPLAPKAYELLVALVKHAGRLVTKQELLERVWPDAYVEEGIISVHVSSLRKALGNRDFIETVSRTGYRFTAPVTRKPPTRDSFSLRWPIGVLPSQPAVHELIGRGRSHLLTASMPEIPKAVAAFRSAIELDPTYAAAHAGLALACCAQAELRLVTPPEAYAEARDAALRALAMEPTYADAQVALGNVLFLSDWNWVGAQRCLERALELDPDHTDGHLLYGRLLEALGKVEEGLAAKRKALERNPSSALVHTQIALSYWNLRQYDEVIEWGNRALELDAAHLLAREFVAAAYWKKGDFDRHMAENLKHAESYGAPAAALDALKQAYAAGGRPGVVGYAIQQASVQSFPPVQLALLFGEAGNLDEAFRQLDLAIERHDPSLVHLAVAPQWDCLRGDPRFGQRLHQMGLKNPS